MFIRYSLLLSLVTIVECLPLSQERLQEARIIQERYGGEEIEKFGMITEDSLKPRNTINDPDGKRKEEPINGEGLWGKREADERYQESEEPGLWGKRIIQGPAQQRFGGEMRKKRNIAADSHALWGQISMLAKTLPAKREEEKKPKPLYYGGLWG